jgi:hypothetical protein
VDDLGASHQAWLARIEGEHAQKWGKSPQPVN